MIPAGMYVLVWQGQTHYALANLLVPDYVRIWYGPQYEYVAASYSIGNI